IAIMVIIFAVAISISGYYVYQAYRDLNNELIRRTALLLGKAVEETLLNAADKNLEKLSYREKKRLRTLMNSMTTESGSIIHILLINDKMRILLSSDKSIEGHEYKSAQELANLSSQEPRVISKTWEGGINVVDVIIPLRNAEGHIFSYLRLVLSQEEIVNFYDDLGNVFIPITIIFVLLFFFAIYFVSRSYRQPLESIKKMAASLNEGDYSYRINYEQNDEFTDTFLRLNKTIERVGVMSESYKKAEKKIASLLKVVEESIILLDSEGNISSYNEATAKLLHCPDDNDFNNYFRHLQSENQEFRLMIERAVKDEQEYKNKETVICLPDGEDLLVRVSNQVFKEEGRTTGILFTFKDVSLFNELERNLQRSMKFSVIANLASSISHEIKNPLSAMAIHTEILNTRLKNAPIEDSEKVRRSLTVLQNEVRRLNRIINQFLNLARVKKTDLSLININSVVRDVLFLIQQQAIERHIRIEATLDKNIDFIYGDPDQLKQVILNIILNAFHAIDKEGVVYVRTREMNKRIFVEIQDTGKGMPPEVQRRIFEPYFTTREDGGGIGLSVSKSIMEAHEGRISFESFLGEGTKFILDFPRKDKTTQLHIQTLRQARTVKRG
ncbi:MAG TPA: PAS domain-containing protein, partial [Caldithrix abyssi]|nr:PAS domain-containing protein [Caldithrix abyssi]